MVGFGLATIVFGLSRNVVLSFAMLALAGGMDNISVVIRGILISSIVGPDPSRARRRWDRARAGLRRSADTAITEWMATRH